MAAAARWPLLNTEARLSRAHGPARPWSMRSLRITTSTSWKPPHCSGCRRLWLKDWRGSQRKGHSRAHRQCRVSPGGVSSGPQV